MSIKSLPRLHLLKQMQSGLNHEFQRKFHVTDDLIARIGLERELEGHHGCVNCLEWNHKGDRLISGSDDVHIILWDPFKHRQIQSLHTGHYGNIFTVKFMPYSNDNVVVTGAADTKIRIHDLTTKDTIQVCGCHAGRVKRIATSRSMPSLFWSASEDGLIMQFDTRCPHICTSSSCSSILINLISHMGDGAEAKCIAINPARPEMLAVGANDPYVRIYDRRMIKLGRIEFPPDFTVWERSHFIRSHYSKEENNEFNLPLSCASYYVAGHLPSKLVDYRKKHRTLASTYITFSPDGTELLVNLGGEQIYLFDVLTSSFPKQFTTNFCDSTIEEANNDEDELLIKNGCRYKNGFHCNNAKNGYKSSSSLKLPNESKLPPFVEKIKSKANEAFEKHQYTLAVSLYNEAILRKPNSAVLFSNRAAALMKRQWDGDIYSAMKDCIRALNYDPDHMKAHFRLARCLNELMRHEEAKKCLKEFKNKFSEFSKSHACKTLEKDISSSSSSSNSNINSNEFRVAEKIWRRQANDYETRFCGHCNTTTDIKEANFFGSNGQYIVAGSDDGSFFIWDKTTTNIKRILRGDDSIVNCLQPHPSYCLLASSGIDPVVRLWSPRPEVSTL